MGSAISYSNYTNFGSTQIGVSGFEFKKGSEQLVADTLNRVLAPLFSQQMIAANQVKSISANGLQLQDGRIFNITEEWGEICKVLSPRAIHHLPPLPSPFEANEAENEMDVKNLAKLTFEFLEEPHYLDQIQPPAPRNHSAISEYDAVRKEVKLLAGDKFDPEAAKCRESSLGVQMELSARKNYRMKIELEQPLQEFFKRESFASTEVFAKNCPFVPGGITSSFNRFADTVTMLRKIEAEDGSSDCYTGRVDTYEKAKDQASFIFLSELNLLKNGQPSKGIEKNQDGTYTLRFAVQSLLTLLGSEWDMVNCEINAFEQLAKNPIVIPDPADPSKTYTVHAKPFPVAAMNFNYMNTVEALIPDAASGKSVGEELTKISDKSLFEYAESFKKNLDSTTQQMIDDTILNLQDPNLEPWELLMNRSFLCQLLQIPQVIHCKSSVDRTNIGAAIATAMKQFLRAKIPVIQENGRYLIHKYIKMQDKNGAVPFKELIAYSLTKGLKISQFARYSKGYKFNSGWAQHRALHALLPDRYLKNSQISPLKKLGLVCAAPILIALYYAVWVLTLLFPILYLKQYKKGYRLAAAASLALTPFKAIQNYDRIFPKKAVTREADSHSQRALLITKKH